MAATVTTLGERIKLARDGAGLTREQLAKATGVNWRTIARYERGETVNVSVSMVQRIARVTGKPLHYFITEVAA